SVATLSFDINQLGRCREVAYITLSSSRVKLFFSLILFRISRLPSLACWACHHIQCRLIVGQWRRIIGSQKILASVFLKKNDNRLLFKLYAGFYSKIAFLCLSKVKRRSDDRLSIY
ncbi:hypothetical protein, partial [Providencia stuartii]